MREIMDEPDGAPRGLSPDGVMPEGSFVYCDVAVPAPVDGPFTYRLPETLRHRVKPGCRLAVPFGARVLTGVVLKVHNDRPAMAARDAMRLLGEEPALDPALLKLGSWIASYYCAPLGETLRSMLPPAVETRPGKLWHLTDVGRDAVRQLMLAADSTDPAEAILRMLEERPQPAARLAKELPAADRVLRALERRGLIAAETVANQRDPLRAPSRMLRVDLAPSGQFTGKLGKAERELRAFLELHPGSHNLRDLEGVVKGAGAAARALARKGLAAVKPEISPIAFQNRPRHSLNPAQQAAFESIREALEAREFRAFLLHGVTGSGKTEVYLNAIEAAAAQGRGALMLVPEIALTPAVAGQFFSRFGERVAILHSAFSGIERSEQWRRIRAGEATVVVGTRSGVFAPVKHLGLIVVDEEHDGSYKQEETPRYHGRDVAVVRAQAEGACVVLGSATPSLESRYNAERGRYRLLELPGRIEARPMPTVELIDMREEFLETRKQAPFSRKLVDAIEGRLANREQTIVLLNRRGFSSYVTCRSCGHRVECINCSVTLTFHKRDRRLLCHYCGYAEKVPTRCPKCQAEHLYFVGVGSERVEEDLHQLFPTARIARLDRDAVSGKRRFESILNDFREGNYDILVGTQMIAKGHDIPNVTLVGVVSADVGLGVPDFRAAERTFQLLTQVAGRAGRGDAPGIVLMQTVNPEHYAVSMAASQDYQAFYQKELHFRRMMAYPPFSAMANLLVRSEKKESAMRMSAELTELLTPPPERMKVLGPAEAPVPRLKNEYRYQLLIKSASRKALGATLRKLRAYTWEHKWPATALAIDVDPMSLS
jgi:primosomal protein N' (replication factor Y) (superfamily II helicase)